MIVEIEIDDVAKARAFVEELKLQAPPAARIDTLQLQECEELVGFADFRILASESRNGQFTLVAPDLATCAECLQEIQAEGNRRFRYPFANCTNCGPRYSITRSTPYDRKNTTMVQFAMCPGCTNEYSDITDRRYHAEPIACALCGPRLELDLIFLIRALEQGQLVALKGLGGFQMACDAANQ